MESIEKLKKSKEIHNYAYDLLRIILAFEVIMCHFWVKPNNSTVPQTIDFFRSCAAPTFFLLSFFLNSRKIYKGESINRRVLRIIIPFLFWGIIGWMAVSFINILAGKRLDFSSLIWQICTGHGEGANPPLWFLAVLLWTTLLYSIVYKVFGKKKGDIIAVGLMLVAIFLQYTELNYKAFQMLPYGAKYPLGRIAEMIPYASIGIILGEYKGIILKRSSVIVLACVVLGVITILLPDFLKNEFGYSGAKKLLFSIMLFLIFHVIGENDFNKGAKNCISLLSRFSLGVYCCHYLVGNVIRTLIEKVGVNSILVCFVVLLLSLFISFIISKIPIKNIRYLVE